MAVQQDECWLQRQLIGKVRNSFDDDRDSFISIHSWHVHSHFCKISRACTVTLLCMFSKTGTLTEATAWLTHRFVDVRMQFKGLSSEGLLQFSSCGSLVNAKNGVVVTLGRGTPRHGNNRLLPPHPMPGRPTCPL